MKNTIYILKILLGVVILLTLSSSCKKFDEIDPPANSPEASKVFSTDQTATSATVGLYAVMVQSNLIYMNGALTIYPGLSADELTNTAVNSDYDAFKNNSLLSTNSSVTSRFWANPYKNIYQANAVLEGLQASTALSTGVKEQLQGEMLFTRALNYFYLVNLLGDIPYITTTDYRVNGIMPRTPASTVNQQVIEDLLKAKALLTASFPVSSNTRPSQMAVTALLARAYLYQKEWAKAEAQASEVIASNKYRLESNLNNVFISTSGEILFQMSKPASNTAEGASFIPASATTRPTFTVTPGLFAKFAAGDNRKTNWLKSNTVSGVSYYYPYKYKVRSSTTVTENYVVLRLAELYLIRSEARAQLNNISGAQADLNLIRNRAGLPATTASTQADLITAVLNERQLELFAEWGHRWFDLKRTGLANATLSVVKGAGNWQPEDVLYPIPQSQILNNPNLTQNQGY